VDNAWSYRSIDGEISTQLFSSGGGLPVASPGAIANGGVVRDNLLVRLPSEALCNSDELVALVLEQRYNVVQDVMGSSFVHFVIESEDGLRLRVGVDEVAVTLFHRLGTNTPCVTGVKVPHDQVLSSLAGNALDKGVRAAVGWASKGWGGAGYLRDQILDEPELVMELVEGELGEVGMAPGMRRDLVALVIGPFDALGVFLGISTAPVVSVDEEGGLSAILSQFISNVVCVGIGAIVKGQRNSVVDRALGNDLGGCAFGERLC